MGAAALALGVVPFVALFSGAHSTRLAVLAAASGALSTLLVVVALVLLYRARLELGRASTTLVLAASVVATTGFALFGLSFGAGMNEADAGRPVGVFGSLTEQFGVAALLGSAVAVGVVVLHVLRRTTLPALAAAAITVPVAVIAAPTLLVAFLTPQTPVAAAATLLVVVAVAGPRAETATAAPAAAPPRLAVRVRALGLASLLATTAVWAVGITVSAARSGTETATSALGYTTAVAQLATVPLIVAGTMLVGARAAGTAVRAGAFVAIAAVVAASVAMVALYDPASDNYVLLAGVTALGVACWIGTALWQLGFSRAPGYRLLLGVAGGLGGAILYAGVCVLTGGLGLLLASAFLAIGGRMLVPGAAGRLSPATPPAS